MESASVTQGAAAHGLGMGIQGVNIELDFTGGFPSDSRLKTGVTNFTYGLDAIKALNPKLYKYDKTATEASGLTIPYATDYPDDYYDTERYGLMADNVKSVMPKAVSLIEADKDYETYDKDMLIYTLINAVKELEARVATLEG